MTFWNSLRRILSHPLNRGRKFRALSAFLRWQLGSRLLGRTVVHEWVNGARFFVRNGETGVTGNIYTGLDEFQDMGFVLHFIRSGDVFCDVGANVGSYSILACAACGASGVAFEPVPETFGRLVENIRLNGLESRVSCVNLAVGEVEGRLYFTDDGDTVNHALVPGSDLGSSVSVGVTTLDSAFGDEVPALIKIDVEGFEAAVIRGGRGVLGSTRLQALIVETIGSGARYGWDEAEIFLTLEKYGFSAYSYDPMERMLRNVDGACARVGNTIFIRNAEAVRERVRTAPMFSINGHAF